jgi:hypothetical protein
MRCDLTNRILYHTSQVKINIDILQAFAPTLKPESTDIMQKYARSRRTFVSPYSYGCVLETKDVELTQRIRLTPINVLSRNMIYQS